MAKKLMLQLDDCRRCASATQGLAATLTVWDNTIETDVQSCECISFTWRCVLNLSSNEWCDWFSMHGAVVVCPLQLAAMWIPLERREISVHGAAPSMHGAAVVCSSSTFSCVGTFGEA